MRRLAIIGSLAALVAAIALIAGSAAQGSSSYTFDVIFDNARGLIGGQLVKIAGARAGTIANVTVYHGDQAQIQATVDRKFAFHSDATCTIRPEGLIAENYVNCNPGTANAPLLQGQNGRPPTVPVTHTQEPVSILDLFNIFNLPTRERFQVLVDELGIATAGRGDDINAIIRRANPALGLARQVIGILAKQKAELATIIDATNTIAAQGATHTQAVQNFIQRADQLAALTANHASPLSQAIARLPANLAASQPALAKLDTVARDGTPLLQSIRAAVPYLNRVNNDVVPFANIAAPALAQLSSSINTAIPAIRGATPLVRTLNAYIGKSKGPTALFAKLSSNLERSAFAENFFSVVYYVAAAVSRFDANGHMLSVLLIGPNNGQCGNYDAAAPVPACSAHYGGDGASSYKPQLRRAHHSSARRATTQSPTTTAPATTTTPSAPTPPSLVQGIGKLLSALPGTTTTAQARQTGGALQHLVNYLLK